MEMFVFHLNYNYVSYMGIGRSEDDVDHMMSEIIRRDMAEALAEGRGQGEYPGYLPRGYEDGDIDGDDLVERWSQGVRYVPLKVGEAYDVDYDNLVLP